MSFSSSYTHSYHFQVILWHPSHSSLIPRSFTSFSNHSLASISFQCHSHQPTHYHFPFILWHPSHSSLIPRSFTSISNHYLASISFQCHSHHPTLIHIIFKSFYSIQLILASFPSFHTIHIIFQSFHGIQLILSSFQSFHTHSYHFTVIL